MDKYIVKTTITDVYRHGSVVNVKFNYTCFIGNPDEYGYSFYQDIDTDKEDIYYDIFDTQAEANDYIEDCKLTSDLESVTVLS